MQNAVCYVLICLCLLGCKTDDKNLPDTFDFGTTEANTYSNKYFGLSFQFPENWSVQSQKDLKAITESGEKIIAGDNLQLASALKASQINTAYLFSVFHHPLNTSKTYNASLSLIAENLQGQPHIKRGKDYLFHSKALLKQIPETNYIFEEEITSKTINNTVFDILKATSKYGSYTINQEFYSTIKHHFSLSFVLSYHTAEEKQILHNIISTIKLEDF